jgi:hypothetical protein
VIEGRVWSGRAPVVGVDVSTDGGSTWQAATLYENTAHPWAWRRWSYEWNAEPGQHELIARAADADGDSQPLEPDWNRQGMANNAVQRVPVTVLE